MPFDPTDYGSNPDYYGNNSSGNGSSSPNSTGLGNLANWYASGGGDTTPNSNSGGMSSADWLRWAQFAYGVQQDKKDPKFTAIPQTPEQKKLWELYWANVSNPAVTANRDYLRQFAANQIAQPTPTWTSPHTFSGDVGYGGSGASGNTPSPMKFDWSSYGAATTPASTGTTPPASTSNGSGPTGVAGDPFGHITSPAGSADDPFANFPNPSPTAGSTFLPSNITDIVGRYGKPAGEIVTAIMTANPLLGVKGAWDAYQAWRAGGKEPPGLPQTNRFNNINLAPAGGKTNPPRDTSQSGSTWDISYRDTNTTPGYAALGPGGGSQLGGGGVAPPGGGGFDWEGYYGGANPGHHRNLH